MPGEPEVADQLVWRRPAQGRATYHGDDALLPVTVYVQLWDPQTGHVAWWGVGLKNARRFTQVEAARVLLHLADEDDRDWFIYGSIRD